jgi:two-component system sensor histidine kinase SenX3
VTWQLLAGLAGLIVGLTAGLAIRRRRVVARENSVTVPHRVRVILKSLPHALIIADSTWLVEFANGEAVALGLALPDGRLRPALRELVSKAIDRDGAAEGAIKFQRRGGRDTHLHVFARALPGESRAVVAVFDADAPMASRIAQREFIVNVSHELKTPVGAIALLAEAVEDSADDADAVRNFARSISRENARLALLVEQFIELSRLQSSHTVITTAETDIKDCVVNAAEAVAELAKVRNVWIDTDGAQSIIVTCEPRSLTSAIRNLLDNAVRYSPENRRVVVTTAVAGDHVEIKVIDQGIGIDEPDIPRIFERFYRADRARDRESGGTGIGLAIVKHVARQHGGRVDVWSQPGVGSTFTIIFPRHQD